MSALNDALAAMSIAKAETDGSHVFLFVRRATGLFSYLSCAVAR